VDDNEGMVLVSLHGPQYFSYTIEHERREMGCYPDPETPADLWQPYLWGAPFDWKLKHQIGPVKVKSFGMDKTAVTNAQFARFLAATGYRPRHPENFLKHWPQGKMPPELADYPVVYVDLDDARAYAKWAGKRLPTETEWQMAAQGTDGRAWPWGKEFDAKRVNTTGKLMPALSLPEGRSPFGCYQMVGNAWELTESRRDDGHSRFVILRGGSYYKVEGSFWYAPSGPQPNTTHAKFLLLCPGLDRCATISFRCVIDLE
jgi:formylglycine-generating enzyme required for sulfatase activity